MLTFIDKCYRIKFDSKGRSNDTIKTLEARNNSLKSNYLKLHRRFEDLESKVKAWGKEKMDIEKSYEEKIADV
jgi:uncharacterized protein YlxW (UPF0749 family)